MKIDCEIVTGELRETGRDLVENRDERIACARHGEVGEYSTHHDEVNVDSIRRGGQVDNAGLDW